MKTRRTLAHNDTQAIFDQAVRDRALAILSMQEDGEWISFKSRFLERDPRGEFFVLDYQAFDGEQLPELLPGRYVGISFRHRSCKVFFGTSVQARGHFVLDSQSTIPAVRYRWPEALTELQRRAYYRTPVPESQILVASLWNAGIATRGVGATLSQPAFTGQLLDISCGGAFLRVNQKDAPDWPENKTVGAEIHLGDNRSPLLIDVRFRGARRDKFGQLGLAIQFIGLEMTPDGRMILQRLANTVQRFHRLSMISGSNDWHRQ